MAVRPRRRHQILRLRRTDEVGRSSAARIDGPILEHIAANGLANPLRSLASHQHSVSLPLCAAPPLCLASGGEEDCARRARVDVELSHGAYAVLANLMIPLNDVLGRANDERWLATLCAVIPFWPAPDRTWSRREGWGGRGGTSWGSQRRNRRSESRWARREKCGRDV